MAKPKNLKARDADDTMKDLKKVKFDSATVVNERGWGTVRPLFGREPLIVDWRLQWEGPDYRTRQLVVLKIGKEEIVVAKQELERYLRHV